MVKGNRPVCVGVPEMTPVLVFSDRPVGSEPLESANVGDAQPSVGTVCEYGWLNFPDAMVVDVMRQTGAIVRLSAWLLDGGNPETVIVNENVPYTVGVPAMVPVKVFSEIPVGNAPLVIAQVRGVVPLAAKV